MPILVLLISSLAAGAAVGAAAWRYPRDSPTGRPALDVARSAGEAAGRRGGIRAALDARRHPGTATGLALSLAVLAIVVAACVVGLLAYLVRSDSRLLDLDSSVSRWADRHQSSVSIDLMDVLTRLGTTPVVIVLAIVLVAIESRRIRSRWIAPFLACVIAGNFLVYNGVKELVDRVRPELNPIAESLGPSFPSGHTATAAAFLAAAALVLGRRRGPEARAVLAGAAAGLAVAVASTRLMLNVHWLTDVIAGLAIGWGWFAVAAIAFGGRLLRFGAGAEVAGRAAGETAADQDAEPPGVSGRRMAVRSSGLCHVPSTTASIRTSASSPLSDNVAI
jgi:undecaprenyl-diphosphatase